MVVPKDGKREGITFWIFVADSCFFPFEPSGVRFVEVDGSSFDLSCFSFFFLVFLPPVADSE